jgi:hypothetical protein
MLQEQVVKKWKELGISRAEFEFNCGGDSMNDTTLNFYDENDKVITENVSDLEYYFDDNVYKNVTFYEASDGHYQGEAGVVTIELDTESKDEAEHSFTYSKSSEAEYNETFTEVTEIKLTDEQIEFIEKNVLNINGGEGDMNFNYKRDFIMTEKYEEIQQTLHNLIDDCASEYSFEEADGEQTDWYSYTTNDTHLSELTIDNKCLKLEVSRTFVVYQDANW